MIEGPITFDRMARWILVAACVVAVYLVLHYLSAVLLPFFVAWLFAYLIYPLVKFIQYRLKVKIRAVSIVLAMIMVCTVIGVMIWLIIPPMIEQFGRFSKLITTYMHHITHIKDFPETVRWWVETNSHDIERFLKSENFTATLKETMPAVFNVLGETMSVILSIVASFITLLYMFFILLDYEHLSESWIKIFPSSVRPFWKSLMQDVEIALNNYIRGQGFFLFAQVNAIFPALLSSIIVAKCR